MPHFIEIPKDRKVVEAYQFDGTLESGKTIIDWVHSIGKYGYVQYRSNGRSQLFVRNDKMSSDYQEALHSAYLVFIDNRLMIVSQEEFEYDYQPQSPTEEVSDKECNELTTVGIIEPDHRLTDLLYQVEKLLDGINRKEDEVGPHGFSGWWQTEDGAAFGNIKLNELKKLIQSHWPKNTTPTKTTKPQ
jgi:hypothetical protein